MKRWWQVLEVILFLLTMFVVGLVLALVVNGLVCRGCEYP